MTATSSTCCLIKLLVDRRWQPDFPVLISVSDEEGTPNHDRDLRYSEFGPRQHGRSYAGKERPKQCSERQTTAGSGIDYTTQEEHPEPCTRGHAAFEGAAIYGILTVLGFSFARDSLGIAAAFVIPVSEN